MLNIFGIVIFSFIAERNGKTKRDPSKMKRLTIIFALFFIAHCSLFVAHCNAQQPTQEWVRRYSGLQSSYGSSGLSVKLDLYGNVYVLVKVVTDSTLGDYGVLKYSSGGSLLWSAYYNSPNNLSEQSHAFTVSSSGDVYVTGNTGINNIYHILTVKFNSNGIFQWARVYDGGGPGDDAYDIVLDKQGNIDLTGGSATQNGSTSYPVCIKYNPSGDSLWVRRFVQIGVFGVTTKLVTDDSGNVYTTGYYQPNMYYSSFLTLKYRQNGTLDWYSTYNYETGNQSDMATCISIDSNSNVYVAGISHTLSPGYIDNSLLKIGGNGVVTWASVYKGINGNNQCQVPAGVLSAPGGNMICFTTFCGNGTGGGGYDLVTVTYNIVGDTLWTRRYGGGVGGTANSPSAIRFDRFLHIYVCGTVNRPVSGDDFVTIKYYPTGQQEWVALYNGPLSNSFDDANDMAIDTSTNVYVTGISSYYNGNPIQWEAATIKYSQPFGVHQIGVEIPKSFALGQNNPNPFNPQTRISFKIAKYENVSLLVYDILGREVATIVNQKLGPGSYEVKWDATGYSSGTYFYTIISESFTDTKKAVLIK